MKSGQLISKHHFQLLFRSSSVLLHFWRKVVLYPKNKVATAWIVILFFSSAWRWTPTQGQLTSVRQKTACTSGWPCWPLSWANRWMADSWEAAAHTAAAQAILQLLSGSICVTPAFHLCGSSSCKVSLLCLVTSIVFSFRCKVSPSWTVFYTLTKQPLMLCFHQSDLFLLVILGESNNFYTGTQLLPTKMDQRVCGLCFLVYLLLVI